MHIESSVGKIPIEIIYDENSLVSFICSVDLLSLPL